MAVFEALVYDAYDDAFSRVGAVEIFTVLHLVGASGGACFAHERIGLAWCLEILHVAASGQTWNVACRDTSRDESGGDGGGAVPVGHDGVGQGLAVGAFYDDADEFPVGRNLAADEAVTLALQSQRGLCIGAQSRSDGRKAKNEYPEFHQRTYTFMTFPSDILTMLSPLEGTEILMPAAL